MAGSVTGEAGPGTKASPLVGELIPGALPCRALGDLGRVWLQWVIELFWTSQDRTVPWGGRGFSAGSYRTARLRLCLHMTSCLVSGVSSDWHWSAGWRGLGPCSWAAERISKMVLADISVHIDWWFQMAAPSVYVPRVSFSCLLPGSSLRSAGEF